MKTLTKSVLMLVCGFLLCVTLIGCVAGGEKRKEIDGKPHKVTISKLFGLIPVPVKVEPVLTPEEREAEREQDIKDTAARVEQETMLQKLKRQKWVTLLICGCLVLAAVTGLIAIVTQKVGIFATTSVAAFIMSFVLAVMGNILKVMHSPWAMVVVALMIVVFVVCRKFSALDKVKEAAGNVRGWITERDTGNERQIT